MFQIDDNFLASAGYNVASLSEAQKQQYIDEFTAEANERISERLVSELDDQQIEEFNEIQENPERAKNWLNEFHAGYHDKEEYRQILEGTGSEDDAATFYAAALWMNDAVPRYGELIQEELDNYLAQLVKMREAADAIASN
ncbi:hypothetical protein KC967_03990 [Candidatus Saccharibacteria bacterium]|nr:hypothetical protein [Candidatus Saccharibacteria bacterium]